MNRSFVAALALTGLASLCSCASDRARGASTDMVSGQCQASAASSLVGLAYAGESEARRISGAASVRRVGPGEMVTQDFRANRVTVTMDASGRVVAASCG